MEQRESEGMELLDEAAPRRRGLQGRELLLGLLLLLAVAVWGGWDWWQQQAHYPFYQAGQRHAAANEWDQARDAYLAAGDYQDAPARAADAASRIARRNSSYDAAATAVGASNWPAALRDLQAVQAIQPHFRDSDRLIAQARPIVYTMALSGTVALRKSGQTPGLYLYNGGGWSWLPGSDAESQVRGRGQPSCIVYDVPSTTDQFMRGSAEDKPRLLNASRPPYRLLIVARFADGVLKTQQTAFDIASYELFSCGDQGVMGWSASGLATTPRDARLARVRGWVGGYTLAYQPYQDSVALFNPTGDAWAILNFDANDARLVLGDYSFAYGDDPLTTLFIAAPNGTRTLITTRHAIVQAAWLSPDGRYLFVDEISALATGVNEDHRLILLTVDASAPPYIVLDATVNTDTLRPANQNWFEVSFLDADNGASKVLITSQSTPYSALFLLDPATPQRAVQLYDVGGAQGQLRVLSFAGGALLSWLNDAGETQALFLDRDGNRTPFTLDLGTRAGLDRLWLRDERMVFAWHGDPASSNSRQMARVSSGSWPSAGEVMTSTLLFPAATGNSRPPLPNAGWSAGPGLLAYVEDGQLRAKSYDGTIDLALENAVEALYDLSPQQPVLP